MSKVIIMVLFIFIIIGAGAGGYFMLNDGSKKPCFDGDDFNRNYYFENDICTPGECMTGYELDDEGKCMVPNYNKECDGGNKNTIFITDEFGVCSPRECRDKDNYTLKFNKCEFNHALTPCENPNDVYGVYQYTIDGECKRVNCIPNYKDFDGVCKHETFGQTCSGEYDLTTNYIKNIEGQCVVRDCKDNFFVINDICNAYIEDLENPGFNLYLINLHLATNLDNKYFWSDPSLTSKPSHGDDVRSINYIRPLYFNIKPSEVDEILEFIRNSILKTGEEIRVIEKSELNFIGGKIHFGPKHNKHIIFIDENGEYKIGDYNDSNSIVVNDTVEKGDIGLLLKTSKPLKYFGERLKNTDIKIDLGHVHEIFVPKVEKIKLNTRWSILKVTDYINFEKKPMVTYLNRTINRKYLVHFSTGYRVNGQKLVDNLDSFIDLIKSSIEDENTKVELADYKLLSKLGQNGLNICAWGWVKDYENNLVFYSFPAFLSGYWCGGTTIGGHGLPFGWKTKVTNDDLVNRNYNIYINIETNLSYEDLLGKLNLGFIPNNIIRQSDEGNNQKLNPELYDYTYYEKDIEDINLVILRKEEGEYLFDRTQAENMVSILKERFGNKVRYATANDLQAMGESDIDICDSGFVIDGCGISSKTGTSLSCGGGTVGYENLCLYEEGYESYRGNLYIIYQGSRETLENALEEISGVIIKEFIYAYCDKIYIEENSIQDTLELRFKGDQGYELLTLSINNKLYDIYLGKTEYRTIRINYHEEILEVDIRFEDKRKPDTGDPNIRLQNLLINGEDKMPEMYMKGSNKDITNGIFAWRGNYCWNKGKIKKIRIEKLKEKLDLSGLILLDDNDNQIINWYDPATLTESTSHSSELDSIVLFETSEPVEHPDNYSSMKENINFIEISVKDLDDVHKLLDKLRKIKIFARKDCCQVRSSLMNVIIYYDVTGEYQINTGTFLPGTLNKEIVIDRRFKEKPKTKEELDFQTANEKPAIGAVRISKKGFLNFTSIVFMDGNDQEITEWFEEKTLLYSNVSHGTVPLDVFKYNTNQRHPKSYHTNGSNDYVEIKPKNDPESLNKMGSIRKVKVLARSNDCCKERAGDMNIILKKLDGTDYVINTGRWFTYLLEKVFQIDEKLVEEPVQIEPDFTSIIRYEKEERPVIIESINIMKEGVHLTFSGLVLIDDDNNIISEWYMADTIQHSTKHPTDVDALKLFQHTTPQNHPEAYSSKGTDKEYVKIYSKYDYGTLLKMEKLKKIKVIARNDCCRVNSGDMEITLGLRNGKKYIINTGEWGADLLEKIFEIDRTFETPAKQIEPVITESFGNVVRVGFMGSNMASINW